MMSDQDHLDVFYRNDYYEEDTEDSASTHRGARGRNDEEEENDDSTTNAQNPRARFHIGTPAPTARGNRQQGDDHDSSLLPPTTPPANASQLENSRSFGTAGSGGSAGLLSSTLTSNAEHFSIASSRGTNGGGPGRTNSSLAFYKAFGSAAEASLNTKKSADKSKSSSDHDGDDAWFGWRIGTEDNRLFYYKARPVPMRQYETPEILTQKVFGRWRLVYPKDGSQPFYFNRLLNLSSSNNPIHTLNVFDACYKGDLFYVHMFLDAFHLELERSGFTGSSGTTSISSSNDNGLLLSGMVKTLREVEESAARKMQKLAQLAEKLEGMGVVAGAPAGEATATCGFGGGGSQMEEVEAPGENLDRGDVVMKEGDHRMQPPSGAGGSRSPASKASLASASKAKSPAPVVPVRMVQATAAANSGATAGPGTTGTAIPKLSLRGMQPPSSTATAHRNAQRGTGAQVVSSEGRKGSRAAAPAPPASKLSSSDDSSSGMDNLTDLSSPPQMSPKTPRAPVGGTSGAAAEDEQYEKEDSAILSPKTPRTPAAPAPASDGILLPSIIHPAAATPEDEAAPEVQHSYPYPFNEMKNPQSALDGSLLEDVSPEKHGKVHEKVNKRKNHRRLSALRLSQFENFLLDDDDPKSGAAGNKNAPGTSTTPTSGGELSRRNLMMKRLKTSSGKNEHLFYDPVENVVFEPKNRKTLVHFACIGNQERVVEYLLKCHSFGLNTQDRFGFTPLHLSVRNGSVRIAELLLKSHADVNKRTFPGTTGGDTALHMVSGLEKAVQMARLLLDYRCDVGRRNGDHATPLQVVTRSKNLPEREQLVELLGEEEKRVEKLAREEESRGGGGGGAGPAGDVNDAAGKASVLNGFLGESIKDRIWAKLRQMLL